ncbi:long-chain fatty acid--CoA ligase [Terriglobus albidus]|uniref:Long-chain fatty acid--CoA ligase n=1 Tax=Terriglobus albidus TaxID=1592106 RepID=A0A5B9EDQ0_9BACT|nr:AMP-binding protein [Terriglobus albidus]QEE28890.1 long-chain fatty acid--CoA ligase [Terriglobus albidus]
MIYTHTIGRAIQYFPNHIAIRKESGAVTFLELDSRVRGIAATLRQQGFLGGDRLALLMPNGPDYIELIYACGLLGIIAVPINTRYAQAEIDRLLKDARPRGIIRHSKLPSPTVRLQWECVIDVEPLQESGEPYGGEFYDPQAVLALIYTSGTTGQPKGAALTHSGIFSNIYDLDYWLAYREQAVFLHASPMFHIADFPAIFAAPVFGATQATLARFDPEAFCKRVEVDQVTHTVLVPTMINALCRFEQLGEHNLQSLDVLAYGGSPIAPSLVREVREKLPNAKLLQVYGLSEAGFLTGLKDEEHTEARLRSCGRTCPGVDLRVITANGQQASAGELGELVARGPGIMMGYWRDVEEQLPGHDTEVDETAAVLREGAFHTGDIGYQDPEGYFFIVDRAKEMIVSGGENVYSGEVEAAIYELPQVKEAAVFGIPDPKWGEIVAAAIVLRQGASLSAAEVIEYCRGRIAAYKLPRHIDFVLDELPKSGSGKILKRTLRERYWEGQPRRV